MSTGVFPCDVYSLLFAAQLKTTHDRSKHSHVLTLALWWQVGRRAHVSPSAQRPSWLSASLTFLPLGIRFFCFLVLLSHFSGLVLHFSPLKFPWFPISPWFPCQKRGRWRAHRGHLPSPSPESPLPFLLDLIPSEDLIITNTLKKKKCLDIFPRPLWFFFPPEEI